MQDHFSKKRNTAICMLFLLIRVRSQDSFNKSQKSKKTTAFSFSSLEYIVDWTHKTKASAVFILILRAHRAPIAVGLFTPFSRKKHITESSIVKENESCNLCFNVTQYKINIYGTTLGLGWKKRWEALLPARGIVNNLCHIVSHYETGHKSMNFLLFPLITDTAPLPPTTGSPALYVKLGIHHSLSFI